MNKKRERRVRITLLVVLVAAILLLSVPTLMAIFYHISPTWFKILNTTGLVLVTIRLVMSLAIGVSAVAVKGETTKFKKTLDKEASFLFAATLILQFVNFMFIHFD